MHIVGKTTVLMTQTQVKYHMKGRHMLKIKVLGNIYFLFDLNLQMLILGQEDKDKDGLGDKCDIDADGDGISLMKSTGNCTKEKEKKAEKAFLPCLYQNLSYCAEAEVQYNKCFEDDNCFLDANPDQKNR